MELVTETTNKGLTRDEGHTLFDELVDLDYRAQLRDLGDQGYKVAIEGHELGAQDLLDLAAIALNRKLKLTLGFGGDVIFG